MANPAHCLIGVSEARNRLGALLDRVEAGEEIVITRRGLPVARLVSAVAVHDRVDAKLAADALLAATRGWRLNGLTVNELKAEGLLSDVATSVTKLFRTKPKISLRIQQADPVDTASADARTKSQALAAQRMS